MSNMQVIFSLASRAGKGTLEAVLQLQTYLVEQEDQVVAFIDISGAFDCIDHRLLCQVLAHRGASEALMTACTKHPLQH